jgi:hypothetical protein
MAKQVVNRRQKDISRLIRDKKQVHKDIAKVRKKKK